MARTLLRSLQFDAVLWSETAWGAGERVLEGFAVLMPRSTPWARVYRATFRSLRSSWPACAYTDHATLEATG